MASADGSAVGDDGGDGDGAAAVFVAFLRLGLTSFGGPVAHLAYFRQAFVTRRGWLTERQYASLVALCQALPGPASSQVGMAIGLGRAGWPGLLAAWLGFTLPSAVALAGLALWAVHRGMPGFAGAAPGWLLGVKAAVVGVVAHAVLGMARAQLTSRLHAGVAALAAAVTLLRPDATTPFLLLALGALGGAGLAVRRGPGGGSRVAWRPVGSTAGRGRGWRVGASLGGFLGLLVALSWAPHDSLPGLFARFYRTGALVFGGGHVVLPLLDAELVKPGLVTPNAFLTGYGLAQMVPGPLFTFAAWLGALAAVQGAPGGGAGALVAVAGIFLPSLLLIGATAPLWQRAMHLPAWLERALSGVNAVVVGLLLAALIDPVGRAGVTGLATGALAAAAFLALARTRVPAWLVVPASALVGGLAL